MKDELERLKHLKELTKYKQNEIRELEEMKTAIKSQIITGAPKSRNYGNDRLDNILIKIEELKEQALKDIEELIDKRRVWGIKIKTLCPEERLLIEM